MPGRTNLLTSDHVNPSTTANAVASEPTFQIRVKFVSKSEKYEMPSTSFMVPTAFDRKKLSELVNNVLKHSEHVAFDFLVDKELLRLSIQEYLDARVMSTENVLVLEFFESTLPPELSDSLEEPDWISAVSMNRYAPFLATGSYDGHFRIWSDSGCQVFDSGSVHERPIKAVCWLLPEDNSAPESGDVNTIISGGADGLIKAWTFRNLVDSSVRAGGELTPSLSFNALEHEDCITGLSLSASGAFFASSSADGSIRLWTTELTEVSNTEVSRNKKRRTEAPTKASVAQLLGHTGAVNAVAYKASGLTKSEKDADAIIESDNTIYSVGNDHSLKCWNTERGCSIASFSAGVVARCLDTSFLSGLVATGHVDRKVRLWDPRATKGAACKIGFAPLHKSWISGVKWSSENEHMLASTSLDGQTKIWDIRSPRTCLYNLTQPATTAINQIPRLLSLDWCKKRVVTAGENKTLYIWSIPT